MDIHRARHREQLHLINLLLKLVAAQIKSGLWRPLRKDINVIFLLFEPESQLRPEIKNKKSWTRNTQLHKWLFMCFYDYIYVFFVMTFMRHQKHQWAQKYVLLFQHILYFCVWFWCFLMLWTICFFTFCVWCLGWLFFVCTYFCWFSFLRNLRPKFHRSISISNFHCQFPCDSLISPNLIHKKHIINHKSHHKITEHIQRLYITSKNTAYTKHRPQDISYKTKTIVSTFGCFHRVFVSTFMYFFITFLCVIICVFSARMRCLNTWITEMCQWLQIKRKKLRIWSHVWFLWCVFWCDI